ncbi:MAG: LuxR C-terminal-related transcriptional regulator [Mycobacterium sp.]
MGPSPSDLADRPLLPTHASAELPRPRLEAALDRVQPAGIGIVVAPAGSGKSVLLGQWARRSAARVCQMRVTASHDDPVLFARSLVSAFVAAAPEFDPGIAELVSGPALGPAFVNRLRAELESLGDQMVVVIDDVHLLDNELICGDLARLLGRLPQTVRVLMGARWDPPLRLQRLRLDGRLMELRASDLAFTGDESRDLLESVSGRPLSVAQAEALHARTEGWAAGLQLAGISLQRVPDADAFIDQFTGSDRLIADYLAEEVLDDLEPGVRRFLLSTSVLEWLDADLCDAVTGDGNGAEMLDLLAWRSLFLVHPGTADGRLRYHHLFADLLRYRLRVQPGEEPRLRRRAAQWLLDHGNFADAVEQSLAAGEPGRVADLVIAYGQDSFERGEAATLARWLEAARNIDPSLSAAVEVNLLAAQIAAFQTDEAVETYRRLRRRADLSDGDSAAAAALYACAGLDDLPMAEVFKAAETATGLLRTADDIVIDFLGVGGRDSVEFLAECMVAVALLFDGDLDRSAAKFEAVRDLPGAQYRVWKIYALGGLALARALAGHANEARSNAMAALEVAEANGITYHHSLAFAHFALVRVALDQLDQNMAAFHLGESGIRAHTTRLAANVAIQHLLEVEQTALWKGPDAALTELRSSDRHPWEPKVVTGLRQALETRMLIAMGKCDQARALLDINSRADALTPQVIDLKLATGDAAAARQALSQWDQPKTLRCAIEHEIRTAAVAAEEGARSHATLALRRALELAEQDGLRAPFLEQAEVHRMLRREVLRGSQGFARSIISRSVVRDDAASAGQLEAPLTEREREVLDYLPTRLSNSEIARALFVSTNTVKTHLRHLYIKLAVTDRDEAVEKAAELGLL